MSERVTPEFDPREHRRLPDSSFVNEQAARNYDAAARNIRTRQSETPVDILHEEANSVKAALECQTQEQALSLVSRDGNLLESLPEEYKDNEQVVLAAAKEFEPAIKFASERLVNDRNFVILVLDSLEYPSLYEFPDTIKDDEEIARLAIKKSEENYRYISERLKANREIALMALRESGHLISDVPTELLGDEEIILTALENESRGGAFPVGEASEELRNNPDFRRKALAINPESAEYF